LEAHVRELLDLLVRWVHLIAGIMWIGNSMLFNWLDRNLVKRPGAGEGHEGEIWMVHSGGFYQVEKKQLEPSELPDQLHWFKWQNGVTWISGICLLGIVYYMGKGSYLVDPSISDISVPMAMGLSVGTVVLSWVAYDLLWRSPLARVPAAAAGVSVALLAGIAFGLTQVLSGRAAYIHVGVVMGTLMTGNVWMVIMPSQRELLEMTKSGKRQSSTLAYRAKQRSIHNNYMTFPLLFIMVSNHFPSTYGSSINWLILGVLMLTGALVRHFMNIRFWWGPWLPSAGATAAIGIIALYALTMPKERKAQGPVSYAAARAIIDQRCIACHSARPTDDVWKTAPAGVMLDTTDQVKNMVSRIRERAVITRTMPLGNKTGMTDAERDALAGWIEQGAKTSD
jgi:uncharacterized membrane protein